MEAIKILLAVALLNIVGVSALKADESFFSQNDKQMHIGISVFTSIAGNAFCHQQFGWTRGESWWCGLGTALLVGAIKEATDDSWDNQDMLADGIGGVIGTTGMWTIYEFQSGK